MLTTAFDIELFNIVELPPGGDLNALGPFDLSIVAATSTDDRVWTWPDRVQDGGPGSPLTSHGARDVLETLASLQEAGHRIVAWNGLSFDLRWLGVASGDMQLARQIAYNLYDPMLQIFCLRGFPLGLAKVAAGLGINAQKTMGGAEAPVAWQDGRLSEVRAYVINDCRMTLEVVSAIERHGGVRWVSNPGNLIEQPFTLLPVVECLRLPLPDARWMTNPIPRTRFADWLAEDWPIPTRLD